ncbi:glycosyltransferase [Zobellia nedashkovskayae]
MAPQANYFHCDETLREVFWKNKWKHVKDKDKFIITTTIRSNLYKGLETIFETCEILNNLLTKEVEWRVIGVNPGVVYVKTAAKIAGVKLSESKVKLLGARFGDDLVEELLDSDLYVHPSHIENSPNAVQEAMLLGMPVVATNCGGTPCILKNGQEGLLVQNKDPFSMAGAILEIIEAPDVAQKMGENARKRSLKRNDGKIICSDLMTIFDNLKI